MTSKEIFLRVWEREFRITVKVFEAFRGDQLEMKPHERSRPVRDLAWQCVVDEGVIAQIVDGRNDLRNVPPAAPPPETMEEILAAYRSAHGDAVDKLSRLREEDFSKTIRFVTRFGQGTLEQAEAFWANVMDQVHHRGQLTVYLRLAGGKVPSIYGPSGDEPQVPGAV